MIWARRVLRWFRHNWELKVMALLLAIFLWLTLNIQYRRSAGLSAPPAESRAP